MDRRETIKAMLLGTLAGGVALSGCDAVISIDAQDLPEFKEGGYGRTYKEKQLDEKLKAEQFFTEAEAETLSILVDIILPSTTSADSATGAGVPEFLEFIVKDMPKHQLPIRGGLMWLDNRSNRMFNKIFSICSSGEQIQLIDEIAYPDKATHEVAQGVKFFSLLRNLTLTGYYTSEAGIKDLGYKGNTPNVWDGVPEEVLRKHNLQYDPEWLAKCIDQDKRMDIARWDEEGNLTNS